MKKRKLKKSILIPGLVLLLALSLWGAKTAADHFSRPATDQGSGRTQEQADSHSPGGSSASSDENTAAQPGEESAGREAQQISSGEDVETPELDIPADSPLPGQGNDGQDSGSADYQEPREPAEQEQAQENEQTPAPAEQGGAIELPELP